MLKMTFLATALALASGSALATTPVGPSGAPLTLGEQFVVRAYAGNLEGVALSKVVKAKTVGVAVNNSTICVALAGALAGEFLGHHAAGQAHPLSMVAFTAETDASQAAATLKNQDAIALLFGGQISDADNAASVKGLLGALAKDNYSGALFLHLTVAAKKWVDQAAAEDTAIAEYLAKKDNIFALAVDVEKKQGHVMKLTFKDGKPTATSVFETPLSEHFLDLFKRRLIPAK